MMRWDGKARRSCTNHFVVAEGHEKKRSLDFWIRTGRHFKMEDSETPEVDDGRQVV